MKSQAVDIGINEDELPFTFFDHLLKFTKIGTPGRAIFARLGDILIGSINVLFYFVHAGSQFGTTPKNGNMLHSSAGYQIQQSRRDQ